MKTKRIGFTIILCTIFASHAMDVKEPFIGAESNIEEADVVGKKEEKKEPRQFSSLGAVANSIETVVHPLECNKEVIKTYLRHVRSTKGKSSELTTIKEAALVASDQNKELLKYHVLNAYTFDNECQRVRLCRRRTFLCCLGTVLGVGNAFGAYYLLYLNFKK